MSIRIQCESCQRTFQVPDVSEGKQTRCPSCQTLILIKRPDADIPESTEKPIPEKPTPVKATPAKATPVSAAQEPIYQSEGISVYCLTCGKELRAPSKAVGKAIRCPVCRDTISVPSDFTIQPVQVQPIQNYTAHRASAYPSNPLQDDTLWSSIPPASASAPYAGTSGFDNPYAATPSYGGGGARRGSSRATRVIQYNIIGALMMLWSGVIVLGCIIRPLAMAIRISNLPPNSDYTELAPLLIGTVIGIAIGLAIAYFMFQGGYNIYYQTDLESAKQIAIFCAIPCCGSCMFPVGIWACFLVFGRNAQRDFGG